MIRSPAALLLLAAALSLSACSDPLAEAQKADTIEAYEKFVAENPSNPRLFQAAARLEELYFEKAKASGDLADFDAWLEKFPKGALREKVEEARQDTVWRLAQTTNTAEAWQKFLDEYPKATRELKIEARERLHVAETMSGISISEVEVTQVNLAEDPKGPLDGWGFYATVKNTGDKPMEKLNLKLSYLGEGGRVLDSDKYPAVADHLPGYLPMPDGFEKPIKPGESRTWEWTVGDLPEGWTQQVKLEPVEVIWQGDPK